MTTLAELLEEVCDNVGNPKEYGAAHFAGDGSKTRAKLPDPNLIAGTFACTIDGDDPLAVHGVTVTVDEKSGWVTLLPAPTAGEYVSFTYQFRVFPEGRIIGFLNDGIVDLYEREFFYVLAAPDTSLSTADDAYEYTLAQPAAERIVLLEYQDEDSQWLELRNARFDKVAAGIRITFDEDPGAYPLRVTYTKRPSPFPGVDRAAETLETTTGLPASARPALVAFACWKVMLRAITEVGLFNLRYAANQAVANTSAANAAAGLWRAAYETERLAGKMPPLPVAVRD